MLYQIMRSILVPFSMFLVKDIRGLNNVPKKGAFILASNHCSYLDPIIVPAIFVKYHKRNNIPKSLIKFTKDAINPIEAVLWDYGAGIRALSVGTKKGVCSKTHTLTCAHYAVNCMRKTDGSFKFKESDNSSYIRELGHIFDGLSQILALNE